MSKQIEHMKEFGSAAPVLSDVHAVSDVSTMGQSVQADRVVVDAVSESNVFQYFHVFFSLILLHYIY